jgi:hypothetical protein
MRQTHSTGRIETTEQEDYMSIYMTLCNTFKKLEIIQLLVVVGIPLILILRLPVGIIYSNSIINKNSHMKSLDSLDAYSNI